MYETLLKNSSLLDICCNFRPFSCELYPHSFTKDWITIETIFGHDSFVDFLEKHKCLTAHSVIFFTDDLSDLSISFKQKVQSVLKIFRLDFFVNVVNVQRLLGLLDLRGFLVVGLYDLVVADHFMVTYSKDVCF